MIKLMLDNVKYNNKPDGIETSKIQNRIQQTEINIEDLAIALCNGQTCKPALLNGTKCNSWVSQDVFMLDFDHDTTIEKEIENCIKLNIIPVFLYKSFSHSDFEHHFRMVFVVDNTISDIDYRNKLQISLIKAFEKSDEVTYDATRLFYGGKETPLHINYNARINANSIINKYYKEGECINKKYSVLKQNFIKTSSQHINLNIEAIKLLDVDLLRHLLQKEVLSIPNNKDIYSNLIGTTKTPLYSENEVYNFINEIEIHFFIGINEGDKINCILPNHNDSTPSAHIYKTNITESKCQVYKCFGCGQSLTLVGLVEELANCKRHVAIDFIKEVFNIELVQSDWVKQQQKLLIDSAKYLDSESFQIQFPNIFKLIRTRKLHIQNILLHCTDYVSDKMKYNDKPIFFATYKTLNNVCAINPKRSNTVLSQSLTLFTLLNMLEKVELENIPIKEREKAESISKQYGFKKITSFYQFEEYGRITLREPEKIAKVLIENNISLKGLSREYVYRTFGEEKANKVFPQYKEENQNGMSDYSNNKTNDLAIKLNELIDSNGYAFEKDIRGKGSTEIQWKKSIQEILNLYALKRLRLNNILKETYGISCSGYPFIIVKDI
jgi:hypothetical protein